ncbi:MAG: hypothetical protein QOJ06_924 [Pseudonocardiales bacterium]|nr:hypothetical protein [Pseudonocardiales bacterium]
MYAEFVKYRFDMVSDSVGRDVQLLGDLGVGQAVEQEPSELAFAGSESVGVEDERGDIGGRGALNGDRDGARRDSHSGEVGGLMVSQ